MTKKRYYTIAHIMEILHANYFEVRYIIKKYDLEAKASRPIRIKAEDLEKVAKILG